MAINKLSDIRPKEILDKIKNGTIKPEKIEEGAFLDLNGKIYYCMKYNILYVGRKSK